MKIKYITAVIVTLMLTMTACEDTTDVIGTSLIGDVDKLHIEADTFDVASETIPTGPVLSRSINAYLGRIKDPETNNLIKGDIMIQFNTRNNFNMLAENLITSRDADNKVIADSCEIRLYYKSFVGDSLAQMKVTAYEMSKPMEENTLYYSSFDPMTAGYVKTDAFQQSRTYTLQDHTQSVADRTSSDYTPNIRFVMNGKYTDKNGVTYNNFGTYIMRKYYETPENFRDVYKFIHNINPGFFFKTINGIGSMAKIYSAQLFVHFRYSNGGTETKASTAFVSTEEVLQTTTFTNEEETLEKLINDQTCTYLKTPAGLFTQLTLPISDKTVVVDGVSKLIRGIETGHQNDSINTAKLEIFRKNNQVQTFYSLGIPQTLLLVPLDDLESFFISNKVADYNTTFLASYSSTRNSYTFNNIAGLINMMIKKKKEGTISENWNKVVLVPVTTEYSKTSSSSSVSVLSKVMHDMSLTSTRLMKGTDTDSPIKLSIIYGKFSEQ